MKNIIQIILVLAALGYVIKFTVEHSTRVGDKPTAISASESKVNKPEQPQMTQQQHFDRLKKSLSAISDGKKNLTIKDYSNYNDAMESYNLIVDANLSEKKKLFDGKIKKIQQAIAREEAENNKAQLAREGASEAVARIVIAKQIETYLLGRGIDAYVSTSGTKNDTLKLKSPFAPRPMAQQLMNDTDFTSIVRAANFKRVIVVGGSGESSEITYN